MMEPLRSKLLLAVLAFSMIAGCAGPEASDDGRRLNPLAEAMLAREAPESDAVRAMSLEAKASYYLERRNYLRLRQTLETWTTSEEAKRSLDWSKKSLVSEGDSIFVAYPYAANLQRMGIQIGGDLNETAAMIVAYAFAVIAVDGTKCADPTAPAHRADMNLSDWGSTAWLYLARLPRDKRNHILDVAMRLEARTAPFRKNDYFICSGGTTEWARSDFSKGYEVPTPPGGVGRTLMIPDDPTYVPEFRPPSDYLPKQERERARLPKVFEDLLDMIAVGKH
jgi:hypothetical protein